MEKNKERGTGHSGRDTFKQEGQGIKHSSSQSCEDWMNIYKESGRRRGRGRGKGEGEGYSNSVWHIVNPKERLAVVAVILSLLLSVIFKEGGILDTLDIPRVYES